MTSHARNLSAPSASVQLLLDLVRRKVAETLPGFIDNVFEAVIQHMSTTADCCELSPVGDQPFSQRTTDRHPPLHDRAPRLSQLPQSESTPDSSLDALRVSDLCLLYMEHVRQHYRKDDEATSEVSCIELAIRRLCAVHGDILVRHFSPKRLKEVREAMIEAGLVRSSINANIGRIKRLFCWAVSEELIPVEIYQALLSVKGLQRGRTRAKESEPVRPVADEAIEAALTHMTSVVSAMVRLQLLTGMRPGEVCAMRPRDVTVTDDAVWVYQPESHKTQHHGRDRRVFIGPEGQRLLLPFMQRDPDAFCFSPCESEQERNSKRKAERKSPMTPSHAARRPKGRKLTSKFIKDSYNRAIRRACEAAFGMPQELREIGRTVSKLRGKRRDIKRLRLKEEAAQWRKAHCWSPNQLRHSRATFLRSRFGIEAARVVLGHSDTAVTEVYAERDFAQAAKIMAEVG